ncbi:hypothetical protein GF373_00420, partial [bacterium]|nr:hypothetical protein [bacterium]
MPLANCPRCGSLFNKLSSEICPKCYEEEEELLRATQRYLRENRNASPASVLTDLNEEGLDVTQMLLEKWVQEKRINLKSEEEALEGKPRCMYCNREIKEGERICRTCQIKRLGGKKEKDTLSSPTKDDSGRKSPSAGMHYKK